MSEKMLIATIVVGLAGLAIWLVLRPNKIEAAHEGQWPLATKHLLSEEQLRMFGELQLGLPGLLIMSGVALTRLLYVIPRGSVNDMVERSAYWVQRKNGKSVDFAICDHSSRLLAVVDLKTDRHQRTRDRDHQTEKERMLTDAGVLFLKVMPSECGSAIDQILWRLNDVKTRTDRDGGSSSWTGAGFPDAAGAEKEQDSEGGQLAVQGSA